MSFSFCFFSSVLLSLACGLKLCFNWMCSFISGENRVNSIHHVKQNALHFKWRRNCRVAAQVGKQSNRRQLFAWRNEWKSRRVRSAFWGDNKCWFVRRHNGVIINLNFLPRTTNLSEIESFQRRGQAISSILLIISCVTNIRFISRFIFAISACVVVADSSEYSLICFCLSICRR